MIKTFLLLPVFIALISLACQKDKQLITIVSTKDLVNADVALDGKKVGKLQHLMLHGSWYEKLLQKKYGKSPLADAVAVNIVVPEGFPPGSHEVKVLKTGYKPYAEMFEWPPARNDNDIFIIANPIIDPVKLK